MNLGPRNHDTGGLLGPNSFHRFHNGSIDIYTHILLVMDPVGDCKALIFPEEPCTYVVYCLALQWLL